MTMPRTVALVIVVLSLGAVLSSEDERKPKKVRELEKLLIAQEQALTAAEKRKDWPAIEKMLADDFLEIGGDGNLYTKQNVAEFFPDINLIDYKLSEWQFRRLGPATALVAYRADVNFTFRGQGGPSQFRVSTVWVQQPTGQWLVKFHQATPILPAPAQSTPSPPQPKSE